MYKKIFVCALASILFAGCVLEVKKGEDKMGDKGAEKKMVAALNPCDLLTIADAEKLTGEKMAFLPEYNKMENSIIGQKICFYSGAKADEYVFAQLSMIDPKAKTAPVSTKEMFDELKMAFKTVEVKNLGAEAFRPEEGVTLYVYSPQHDVSFEIKMAKGLGYKMTKDDWQKQEEVARNILAKL